MFNIVTVRSAFVGTYLRSSDLKIFKVWQLCNLNIFKFNIKRLCLIAKDLPLVIILLKSYSYLQILITNVLIILWRVWIHKRSSIPRFFSWQYVISWKFQCVGELFITTWFTLLGCGYGIRLLTRRSRVRIRQGLFITWILF